MDQSPPILILPYDARNVRRDRRKRGVADEVIPQLLRQDAADDSAPTFVGVEAFEPVSYTQLTLPANLRGLVPVDAVT